MSRIEPILSSRRDVGLVKIAGLLCEAWGAKLKEGWARDLLPVRSPPEPEQTPEEMMATMDVLGVVEET